ncbi:hypothetical protein PGIGA_G00060700 [Pangasianodon gigas]|uniref:Uncharacterized protein n=1 Tax=Pangasianodon gigas TaxID=30993 RepID=A0ACC5X4U2_PANGG|nr:hypothetical protein [Pangasianodon gigas]
MTSHWTSPRTSSQESPPPRGLAISTTVPFYDDSFRCHASTLCKMVAWQRVAKKHHDYDVEKKLKTTHLFSPFYPFY